ncbi:Tn3 family transposase [Cysteiniphilum sp. 19S12-1]|uniref:Tn3 family transposase n=1 Tax=Cysteiniphilum sp. 19S12-1 TaxID=3453130 RepID=UPI003F851C2E
MRDKNNHRNKIIWRLLGEDQAKFKKNLRLIFRELNFTSTDLEFNKVIDFLKKQLKYPDIKGVVYTNAPKKAIPKNLYPAIVGSDKSESIERGTFEFFVYYQLSQHLNSGVASLSDSVGFKNFDDDLVSQKVADSQDFTKLGMPILDLPIKQHLNQLKDELESNLHSIHQNISLKINDAINIKDWDKREWTLPYRKQDIDVNHRFFEKLPHINIVDVMHFVHEQTSVLSAFSHILPKNTRKILDNDVLSAAILGKATNHGNYRMAQISNISLGQLREYSNSFLTLENISLACNLLVNEIKKLKIFEYHDINDILHGGIDGQKFKTKRNCLKARPSSKYFHFGKGVSSATLLVNHVPANARLFGANEHESRFIFDLVYNNETEIQPKIISTDSAGSNYVNFALLHLIERQFAPCFKTISNKENMLVGFNKPAYYKEYFIRPSRQAKEQLIIKEWSNIKRVMASLVLKKSTQSVLIRKLCSQTDKNQIKEAIWAYDSIIRSNYLLRYLDDENLRQSVRTALNRNEAYHSLKRTIAEINSEGISGSDDDDLVINDECTRLLSLFVIFYNAYLLSEAAKIKEKYGSKEEIEAFKHISLVAWIHINFYGNYNFDSKLSIELVQQMLNSIIFEPDLLTNK